MQSDEAGRGFASLTKVVKCILKASAAAGIIIGQSNRKAASQEVFYMHVHVIPRFNHEMMNGFPNRKQTHRAELMRYEVRSKRLSQHGSLSEGPLSVLAYLVGGT